MKTQLKELYVKRIESRNEPNSCLAYSAKFAQLILGRQKILCYEKD